MNCEVAVGLLGKYSSRSNGVRHSPSFAHQPAALLWTVKSLWDCWANTAVVRMAFAILPPLPTNPPRFTLGQSPCVVGASRCCMYVLCGKVPNQRGVLWR
jgi:hypothetical protein